VRWHALQQGSNPKLTLSANPKRHALRQGSNLDGYAKQWRLLADCMNNVGLALELASPFFPSAFLLLASVGSISRAITGGRLSRPIGYTWSYLASRIGHLVPIWQPIIGSSFHL
jgi:Vitamin B6 photo-protection and homoeostasis